MRITTSRLRRGSIAFAFALWAVLFAAVITPAITAVAERHKVVASLSDLFDAAWGAMGGVVGATWFHWSAGGAIGFATGLLVGTWLDGLARRNNALPSVFPVAPLHGEIRRAALAAEREFTNQTTESLFALFSGRTALQAAPLVEPFLGMWLRTDGRVVRTLDGGTDVVAVLRKVAGVVECRFSKEWSIKLRRFNQDDYMSVVGRIGPNQNGQQIYLLDCEIDPQGHQNTIAPTAVIPLQQSTPRPPANSGREHNTEEHQFSEKSLDDIEKMLKGVNPLQGYELLKPLDGLWLRFSGSLTTIMAHGELIMVGIITSTGFTLVCVYSAAFSDHLARLDMNASISGVGKISAAPSGFLRLDNCRPN